MTSAMGLPGDNRHIVVRERDRVSAMVTYSLASGFVSLTIGALFSLAASSGAGKLTLWAVVTGISAIAAGVGYESRFFRAWSLAVAWFLHQIDHLWRVS